MLVVLMVVEGTVGAGVCRPEATTATTSGVTAPGAVTLSVIVVVSVADAATGVLATGVPVAAKVAEGVPGAGVVVGSGGMTSTMPTCRMDFSVRLFAIKMYW